MIKNPIYSDLESIARNCFEKVEKIYLKVEKQMKERYAKIKADNPIFDNRILSELNHQRIKRE